MAVGLQIPRRAVGGCHSVFPQFRVRDGEYVAREYAVASGIARGGRHCKLGDFRCYRGTLRPREDGYNSPMWIVRLELVTHTEHAR